METVSVWVGKSGWSRRAKSILATHSATSVSLRSMLARAGVRYFDEQRLLKPTTATSCGTRRPRFRSQAIGFTSVHAYAKAGGNDVAYMYDSPGNDTLTGKPTFARLVGDGFLTRAKFFDSVQAIATGGGYDVASLIDSGGNETFTATPDESRLDGSTFSLVATSFDSVHGYARFGGYDVAHLFDSPGDDTFIGQPTFAKMIGDGFFLRAKFFDAVHAYAKAGGTDTALLYGSAGNDALRADGSFTRLLGEDYLLRTKFFENVEVRPDGGNNTAEVYDAVLEDVGTTREDSDVTAAFGKIVWLYRFDNIDLKDSSDPDSDTAVEAVDKIFAAYWQ